MPIPANNSIVSAIANGNEIVVKYRLISTSWKLSKEKTRATRAITKNTSIRIIFINNAMKY